MKNITDTIQRGGQKTFSFLLAAIIAAIAGAANAATWYWTGDGGDLNWFTPANWNSAADGTGDAATVLASGDSFTFDAVTPSGDVNYNPSGDFNITTVTFGTGLTATVKITGAKITSLGNAVNNNTSYGMEFANEVQFSSTINLTVPTKKIVMSGGATGTEPANHTWFFGKYTLTTTTWSISQAYHLADGGRLVCNNLANADSSSASTGISAGEGAEFIVNGNYTIQHDAPGASYNVVSGRNHKGLLWVKGKILPTVKNSVKTFQLAPSPSNSLDWDFSGRIKAGGIDIQLRKDKSLAYFNPSPSSPCYLALGKDGLTRYGSSVTLYFKNDFVIRCYDDWSLAGQITGIHPTNAGDPYNNNIVFDTSDCDDPSVGHTVTIDNRISGARQVVATGCGRIVWKVTSNYSGMFTGGFVASNGVTVVLHASRAPGTGSLTMKRGTTLAVESSITAGAVGGNSGTVTFEPDTTLALNFTSVDTPPVLWFTETSTLVLPASGEDPLKVKITAADGLDFDFGSEYAITSGGKFPADAVESGKVVLSEDSPAWAKLYVNASGNLAVKVADCFYIKIAGTEDMDIPVPMQWMADNGIAAADDSIKSVAAALTENGANGIPVWQSYCLGLDPQDAASTLLCEAAAGQPSDGKVNIAAKNLNVPAGLSGVAVTAYLDRKNGDGWDLGVASAPVSSGSALLAAPAIESGTSFFRIRVGIAPTE